LPKTKYLGAVSTLPLAYDQHNSLNEAQSV